MRTRTSRRRPPRRWRPSSRGPRRSPRPANTAAPALTPGDFVVTVEENVEIGVKGKTGEIVPKGTKLKVLEIRGSWIGVRIDGKDTTGWVHGEEIGKP